MERAKSKRASRRSMNTRIINEVNQVLQSNEFELSGLRMLHGRLRASNVELKALNNEVETLITDDLAADDYEVVMQYDDAANSTLALLEHHIEVLKTSATPASSTTPAMGARTCEGAPSEHERLPQREFGARLPKLELLRFDGNVIKWQPFWDMFLHSVHENPRLSNTDRFHYLASLLDGPAAQAVAGIQVTDSCYDDALEILKRRFGNKKVIEQKYLGNLRTLKPVKLASDVTALRKLFDTVQLNRRGLRSLGITESSYAAMLNEVLLKVIPADIVVEYFKKESMENTTETSQASSDQELEQLMKFLRIEVECREKSSLVNNLPTTSNNSVPVLNRSFKKQSATPTASVLQNKTLSSPSSCFFCAATDHKTEDCTSDMTLAEKRNKLVTDGRCFRCTSKGHLVRNCRRRVHCQACKRRHASSMCNASSSETPSVTNAQKKPNAMVQVSTQRASVPRLINDVLLQTFRAWVTTSSHCCYIRGVLDNGSQRTFVTESVASKLSLPAVAETELAISAFGRASDPTRRFKMVKITLRSQHDDLTIDIEAIVVPFICEEMIEAPRQSRLLQAIAAEGKHLADAVVYPSVDCEPGVSVLIGSDQLWKLMPNTSEVRWDEENPALLAINTKMGWTLQGPLSGGGSTSNKASTQVCVLRTGSHEDDQIAFPLQRFWDLDAIGIADTPTSQCNADILEEFNNTTKLRKGRYEVALPWKSPLVDMADNRKVALSRLHGLVKRLSPNDEAMRAYDKAIRQYEVDGHAEKVEDAPYCTQHLYYMPHREVIRETSTTTRLRVVFDASSHASGACSLNEQLEKGPNLNADLFKVLIRFRLFAIGITADVQKAFLQISIREEDRDALRFLWFEGLPMSGRPLPKIQEMRMTRVPFGTSASPFLLSATLKYHFDHVEQIYQVTAAKLKASFYVDDLVFGASTTKEALQLYEETKAIMELAGMKMQKWSTNCDLLREKLKQAGETPAEQVTQSKVLGLSWNYTDDTISVKIDSVTKVLKAGLCTKRTVLQASSRIFDPLGLLAPFTIRVKILFQKIWMQGLDWESVLPETLKIEWDKWTVELQDLKDFRTKRYQLDNSSPDKSTHQLHIFTDASPCAYGVVAYIRVEDSTGAVRLQQLLAKSRVAPIKGLTLPRLELVAAVLGARLLKLLVDTLPHTNIEYFCWTDSQVCLSWIKSTATKWKPFVCNRVIEIQGLTDPSRWRHCSGKTNPADLVTRGISAHHLCTSDLWWHGPDWLSGTQETWPASEAGPHESTDELCRSNDEDTTVLACQCSQAEPLFELDKYSSWIRVVRITAWIRRFIHNCRVHTSRRLMGPLTAPEIKEGEFTWMKNAQAEAFSIELASLLKNQPLAKASRIRDLHPFLDNDGILRIKTRLDNVKTSEYVRCPILLPADHRCTYLIIDRTHRRLLHSGVNDTLSELRECFWVIKGRQCVKKVLSRCKVCARFKLQPATAPTAPLPTDRVKRSHPFQVVGVDFAGPVFVKGTSPVKAYIVIFTCAVVRAIHLELCSDMTAGSFLMAFRRFVSRRGLPSVIYSDNALAFHAASRDLKVMYRALRDFQVQDFCSTNHITWKFIAERSPWWGGFWERMIRTVKSCLRKILGKGCFDFEQLVTILAEVENVVNSRPLTYLSADATDPAVLTPSHFLTGRKSTTLPSANTAETSGTRSDTLKHWKYRQQIVADFWKRWYKDYLLCLRSAHIRRVQPCNQLKVNDVVVIKEDKVPITFWKVGRVTDVYLSSDNHVRACKIVLAGGTEVTRPVQLLCPLELGD